MNTVAAVMLMMSNVHCQELAQANIVAVHAYQILLAQKSGKQLPAYEPCCLSKDQLQALVAHQKSLLETDPAAIKSWIDGKQSSFDPAKDLQPLLSSKLTLGEKLPVNVFCDYLSRSAKVDRNATLSIANLYQLCLEIERDGTVLQQLIDLYIALGMPVYVGQFGLPMSQEDFLAAGKTLSEGCTASPYQTTAELWQITGMKMRIWAEKKMHIRDSKVLADELLQEADLKEIVPQLKSLPPQRIAIVGHSFTMDINWSTPSSFTSISASVLQQVNPGVEVRHFTEGGMSAHWAQKIYGDKVLAYKPDRVYFFVGITTKSDVDVKALREMISQFSQAGAKCYVFPFHRVNHNELPTLLPMSKEGLLTIVDIEGTLVQQGYDMKKLTSLDHIHMIETYHRLAAKELLKSMAK